MEELTPINEIKERVEQDKALNINFNRNANLPSENTNKKPNDTATELVENAFNQAVEKLVNERLKGNTPKSSASTTNTMTKEKFRSMSYKEKMDLYNNNKDLFEKLSK